MSEPIDWQITETLLNQLSSMSAGYNTKVKSVQLIDVDFKLPEVYPVIYICPNNIEQDQDGITRNDVLPFILVYIDNSTEKNIHYRYRNVPADIQKCLKKNPSMNGLAHYTTVVDWNNSVFTIDNIDFQCCIIYVTIERTLDSNDPYKLG